LIYKVLNLRNIKIYQIKEGEKWAGYVAHMGGRSEMHTKL